VVPYSRTGVVGLALLLLSCAAGKEIVPDLSKINDTTTWSVINGEPRFTVEDGIRAVRLFPPGGNRPGSNVGMALLEGVEFGEGSIDVDLKGQGPDHASFLGIAFAVADEKTYEAIYFRPFNFVSDDPTHRAHAVQYIDWPEHTWEALRKQSPGVYEAAIEPVPDPAGWFHSHIEVTKKTVSVFVNNTDKPCLVVNRLSNPEKGRLGLWVDSAEGAFGNLKLRRD